MNILYAGGAYPSFVAQVQRFGGIAWCRAGC